MKPSSFLVGGVTAAGLFALAFSGGAYDVVTRQAAALVLWWVVGLGSLVLTRPPLRPRAPGLAVTAFALLVAVWIAVGLNGSLSKERTVIELGRAVAHLGPLVLVGWVLPAKHWRAVFGGLVVAAVAVLVVALGFRLSPGFLGLETSVVYENTRARLAAPLGYWNGVGSWAALTALMLLAVSSHAQGFLVRATSLAGVPLATTVGYLTYSRSAFGAIIVGVFVLLAFAQNRWTTALHAAAAAAAAVTCALVVSGKPEISDATGTAGTTAVLGTLALAGVVLAALAVISQRAGIDSLRMPPKPARYALGLTAVIGTVASAATFQSYGNRAWTEFRQTETTTTAETAERLTSLRGARIAQWESALDTYRADPLHGSGAGTFELSYSNGTETNEFVRDAHSAFIEALSEQGWPGLLFLVGLLTSIGAAVLSAARRASSPLDRGLVAGAGAAVAAFAVGTAIDWFWEVTALAMLVMTLTGLLIAAAKDGTHDQRHERTATDPAAGPHPLPADSQGGRRAWPLRAGLVLVALVAVLVELPGLVGTSEIRRSGQAVASGDLTSARSHADIAIDTMPWASSPFLQRGLVDEEAGQWASARRALRLAIERDPHDWRLPLVLARIEARSGRPEQALEAFRQGKALRRGGSFFQ